MENDLKKPAEYIDTSPGSTSLRPTLSDRIIMLFLVLLVAAIFLRPYISHQSYQRGKLFSDARMNEESIRYLKRAVRLDSENAIAWSLLGFNYKKIGKTEEALKAYMKTLEINPDDIQAAIEASLIFINTKNYIDAIQVLSQHLKKDKRHTDGWMLLATCYEKTNKQVKAKETWELIYYEIDPGNPLAASKLRK